MTLWNPRTKKWEESSQDTLWNPRTKKWESSVAQAAFDNLRALTGGTQDPLRMEGIDWESLQSKAVINDYISSTVKKIQNQEYVSPSTIDDVSNLLKKNAQGSAAKKNPTYLEANGFKLADDISQTKEYYSLFNDEDDFNNYKYSANKKKEYSEFSFDDLRDKISELERKQQNTSNENERKSIQKEKDWLINYSITQNYKTVEEYDYAINRIKNDLNQLKFKYGNAFACGKGLVGGSHPEQEKIDELERQIDVLEIGKNDLVRENELYEKYYYLEETDEYKWTLDNYQKFMESAAKDKAKNLTKGAAPQNNFDRTPYYFGLDLAIPEDMKNLWYQTTDREKQMATYLSVTKSKKAALDYLKDIEVELSKRNEEFWKRQTLIDYENEDFWGKVGMNLASIPASVFGNIISGTEDIVSLLKTGTINPYSDSHSLQNYASIIRQATSEDIDKAIDNDFLSALATYSYQGIMSSADMVVGSCFLGGTGYTISMGLGAFSSQARNLYERGESTGTIVMGATLSSLLEMGTEMIGADRFLKTMFSKNGKTFLKNFLIQLGAEPTEELISKFGNRIIDDVLTGENSEIAIKTRQYVNQGLTQEEAKRKVEAEFVKEAAWEAFSAMISVGSSSFVSVANYGLYKAEKQKAINLSAEKIVNKGTTETLLNIAESLSDDSTVKLNKEIESFTKSDNLNVKKIARLYSRTIDAITNKISNKTTTAIQQELQARGFEGDIAKTANTIFEMAHMEDVEKSDRRSVEKNSIANEIYKELSAKDNSGFEWIKQLSSDISALSQARNLVAISGEVSNEQLKEAYSEFEAMNVTETSTKHTLNGNENNGIITDDNKNGIRSENDVIFNQGTINEVGKERQAANLGGTRVYEESGTKFEKLHSRGTQESSAQFGKRKVVNYSKSSVSYIEAAEDNTEGYKAYTAFRNAGINAVYCDGVIERIVSGIKYVRTEAFTAPDGTVYISNQSTVPANEIYDHERVHVADFTNNLVYDNYEAVLCDNVLYLSEEFRRLSEQINDNQFDGKYDVENIDSYKIFMREIAAYVNQYVLSDPEYAQSLFGGMFSDWNAVVEAVNKFNENMGGEYNGETTSLNPDTINDSEGGEGIASFGGVDTEGGKHLNKAQQDEIRAIGEKLERKVEFEDFYKLDKFKGKKKIPDGYIDKDGNIHINFYAKRPVYFLFKHEITHYLKRAKFSYQDFMNRVIGSNAFKNWLSDKGYSSIDELKAEIMDTYSEVEGLNEAKCYDEILADFVGECLFGGKNKISQDLINALEPKQRKIFLDVIKDIIEYFKNKFSDNAHINSEIESIEKEFIKVYNEAVEVETDESLALDNQEVDYSIASDSDGDYVSVDVSQDLFAGKSVKEMQEIARKFIRDNFRGKILAISKESKAYINKRSSDEYAYPANRRMENSLKEAKMRTAPELDNLLSVSQYIEHRDDDGRHPEATGGWDVYSTRFEVGGNMYVGEVQIMITDRGHIFYDVTKIRRTTRNGGLTEENSAAASGNPSIDSINDNQATVNTNLSNEGDNYSIPYQNSAEDLLEGYDEQQYNDFGWTRYNQILSSTAFNLLTEKVAEIKRGGSFHKSKYGEYIIPVGDESGIYNILVYTDDNMGSPHIRKVIKINAKENFILQEIAEDIYYAEQAKQYDAYWYVKEIYGEENISQHKRGDSKSFWQYSREREGTIGSENYKGDGEWRDGRKTSSNSKGIQINKFSIPNEANDLLERYDEQQYNDFGWARYNQILSSTAFNLLTEKVAEIKRGGSFHKSKYGEYIIPVGDESGIYNILVYTDDNMENPHIRKVIKINAEDINLLNSIRSYIFGYEETNEPRKSEDAYTNVANIYGAENITQYSRQNSLSFRQYSREQEGTIGSENNKGDGERRGGRKTSSNSKGIQINKFSIPNEANDLFDRYTRNNFSGVSKKVKYIAIPDAGKKRHKTTKSEQKYIIDIGKALGRTVVFEDVVEKLEAEGIDLKGQIPDGYIDKNNVIHINFTVVDPLTFVFKHELTHFGEGTEAYKRFVNIVENSKAFKKWLIEKTGLNADIEVLIAVARQSVMDSRTGDGAVGVKGAKAEVIADFVGDCLFTDNGSGLESMLSNFNVKERNAVIQYILDFLSYLKKKLAGYKDIEFEISRLEDSFNRMISEATWKEKNNIKDGNRPEGNRYTFARSYDTETISKAEYMESRGANKEEIWEQTGLVRDDSGVWVYEIDDSEMEFYPEGNAKKELDADYYEYLALAKLKRHTPEKSKRFMELYPKYGNGFLKKYTVADFVKHDKLFKVYPTLREIEIKFENLGKNGFGGYYSHYENKIVINTYYQDLRDSNTIKETLIHELQHAVQYIDKYDKRVGMGGDKKYFKDRFENENVSVIKFCRDYWIPKMLSRLSVEQREKYNRIESNIIQILENKVKQYKEINHLDKNSAEYILSTIKIDDEFDNKIAKYLDDKDIAYIIKILDLCYQNQYQIENFDGIYFELYMSLGHEIEARQTSARVEMSEKERKRTKPDFERFRILSTEEILEYIENNKNSENNSEKETVGIKAKQILEDEDIDKSGFSKDNISRANKQEEKDSDLFANLLGNSLDEYVNSLQGTIVENEYEEDLVDEFRSDEEYSIMKSIGAKSLNYPIAYYPNTDIQIEFVPGKIPIYPPDHTIAGKGCKTGRQIDDIDRLVETYNCDKANWRKEKAQFEVYDEYGEIRTVELHWYQHKDIGKVEYKVKTRGGYVYVDEWSD